MGGTFNPIHYGHLVTAEEARIQFNLDRVLFIPTGDPPHKEGQKITNAQQRYLMTVMATGSNPYFYVSRMEIDRPQPSYTMDTVKDLHEVYKDSQIFFITGTDAVLDILTWKNPAEILNLCIFIAATRPGYELDRLNNIKKRLKDELGIADINEKIHIIKIPALAISSTDIRNRVRTGKPIRYLLPEGVANHIYKMNFYKK
ncbi:MAG: nicotinate-nucleotide adenylyltransferase [Actinobacteria bacterium]|nr:nicotinate-nucleotide adenylyltransferase [Actinomycetota bacterium]